MKRSYLYLSKSVPMLLLYFYENRRSPQATLQKYEKRKKRVFIVGLKWCSKARRGPKVSEETCEASASIWAKKHDSMTGGRVWLTTWWPCPVPPLCQTGFHHVARHRWDEAVTLIAAAGLVHDKTHRASLGCKSTNCSDSHWTAPLPRSDPSLWRLCVARRTDC